MIDRLSVSLGVLCVLGGYSSAASPTLAAVQPRGGQRGTELTLVLSGTNLADSQEVFVYYPGLTVTQFKPLTPTTCQATVKIAPDCRLGEHALRVRTATGVSDLRTFWVGALPTADEKEPNSDFASPQPVPLNCTVQGTITAEDVDHFVVECKKGQRLSVEVEGMRLGGTHFDPYVAVLDSRRFELAAGDDSALAGPDGGCSLVIPADGKYVVQIRESAYGGNGLCQYRLHVGTFPRPTGVFPPGGKPGEEVELRFLGDPAGEIKQKVKLPADPPADFRVHCQTADGVHPAGIKFRVADLPAVAESGANVDHKTATAGPAPGAFHGVIGKPGENDFFAFPAKKGQVFDIGCHARRLGSPLDPVLHVAVRNGGYLTGIDDTGGPDGRLRFTAPQDGEYVLWLHDHLRKGGPDYFYRVELTVPQAGTSVNLPKADGNNLSNQDRQTITVPKGGRAAALLTVTRRDWGGPAAVGFDQLPAGVAFAADPVDPGLGQVPVVFEAQPDAPTAGRLVDFRAAPADPKVVAPSRTRLDVNFCLGINNTIFHRHLTDRVAVAVGEPAPFAIDVVEPKAPLVQNGATTFRVVAKRQPGFKGAITVLPVFTPPGLGITGATVVPENASECGVYANAAPTAAPRKWKTAFMAVGDAGKGAVWVSSQLFTVEVAPPFVRFAQERTAVEQGGKTQLFCKVTTATPFAGKAKATVVGLPAKVTAPPVEFTKDQKEIAFDVATDKTSPAGKHGVFCQVVLEHNGEQVIHNVGGGELRIDVPLPKAAAAAPTPAKPAQPAAAPPKRLSRLEQLRQEQEQREKEQAKGSDKKTDGKK